MMADCNCRSATLPALTLQMHKVQNPEPEASYCVVCRMNTVCCAGISCCTALARKILGLRGFVVLSRGATGAAVRGLNEAGIIRGCGATFAIPVRLVAARVGAGCTPPFVACM